MSGCRCEPKLEGLAKFSEHPAIIVAAYLVVIFPWGVIQNIDFISEKWRTVRHTRHLGYFHLALSIVPLPYIIFYAHLQRISSDFKEMMTAVVVILMAIYHTFRTIWGLLQLDAYKMWCTDLMKRMLGLKMVRAHDWRKALLLAEAGIWEKLKRTLVILFCKIYPAADRNEKSVDIPYNNSAVDESDEVLSLIHI